MRVTAKAKVAEEEDILEEDVPEVEEYDSDLWPTKLSRIEFEESTVKPNDFDVMKKLGYVDEKDGLVVRPPCSHCGVYKLLQSWTSAIDV